MGVVVRPLKLKKGERYEYAACCECGTPLYIGVIDGRLKTFHGDEEEEEE